MERYSVTMKWPSGNCLTHENLPDSFLKRFIGYIAEGREIKFRGAPDYLAGDGVETVAVEALVRHTTAMRQACATGREKQAIRLAKERGHLPENVVDKLSAVSLLKRHNDYIADIGIAEEIRAGNDYVHANLGNAFLVIPPKGEEAVSYRGRKR